jgi:hypothetical protein
MFWKHPEEPIPERQYGESAFDFDKESETEEPMGMEHVRPGMPEKPAMDFGKMQQQRQPEGMNRDTELILAKLDAIKAKMESIDARLAALEKLAQE